MHYPYLFIPYLFLPHHGDNSKSNVLPHSQRFVIWDTRALYGVPKFTILPYHLDAHCALRLSINPASNMLGVDNGNKLVVDKGGKMGMDNSDKLVVDDGNKLDANDCQTQLNSTTGKKGKKKRNSAGRP